MIVAAWKVDVLKNLHICPRTEIFAAHLSADSLKLYEGDTL